MQAWSVFSPMKVRTFSSHPTRANACPTTSTEPPGSSVLKSAITCGDERGYHTNGLVAVQGRTINSECRVANVAVETAFGWFRAVPANIAWHDEETSVYS